MARVGAFCYLPALLRDLGTEPGPIFARFGLDESNFANPDAEISAVVRIGLLVVCSRETGCPHFGLLLGQQFNFSALGPVGFLMRNAPDVRTALNELAVFFHLHTPVASVKLQEGEESSSLIYETTVTTVEGMELVQDAAIAAEWNVMRTLCGPDWLPSEVHLRRKKPRDIDPYRRFFRAPLVFDAEHSAVVFSNSWLAEKVRQADPMLHKLVAGHVEMLLSRTDHDIVVRAMHTLAHMLGSKQCSLAALAKEMSLHPRALLRRLEEGGTTFRELHRSTRHRLARQLLQDTGNSISAIATILGFSGANAFTRAFMQWEGTPPAAWRRTVSRGDEQKAISS